MCVEYILSILLHWGSLFDVYFVISFLHASLKAILQLILSHPLIHPSVHPSIHPSIRLSNHLSIHPSICLFVLFVCLFICYFIYLFIYQEPTNIPSRKKMRWVCATGWCVRRGSLLQDLPVKFNDPKFRNEIFVRIDMKHSYFSNYLFAINFFCC